MDSRYQQGVEAMTGTVVHTIPVKGVVGLREEVVRPLEVVGAKTRVSFIRNGRVSMKWVKTDRISTRAR